MMFYQSTKAMVRSYDDVINYVDIVIEVLQ